ncbi:MAG TPA: hypothetical protein VM431_11370 [Phycisphaerae bacterium]|nr:hypothetical protein [Phycisphaerae bacterium]
MPDKPHLLVNLPAGFFASRDLRPVFARLGRLARVRKRSHDTAETFAKDIAWADACIKWSWPPWTDALLDGAPRLTFSGQLDITQAAARVALDRGLKISVSRGGSPHPPRSGSDCGSARRVRGPAAQTRNVKFP